MGTFANQYTDQYRRNLQQKMSELKHNNASNKYAKK
jgi:hypothetical protein